MTREQRFDLFRKAYRSPLEVLGAAPGEAKALAAALRFKADPTFIELLHKLNITLFVSREYEHLVLALHSDGKKIHQSFYPLPHPSGLAADSHKGLLYVASTRNPNMLVEFARSTDPDAAGLMMPARSKLFSGSHYFHDLVFIGDELYANSVGNNGVIKVDFNRTPSDPLSWQLPQAHNLNGNYFQLNAIACPGKELHECCFSASTEARQRWRPGHRRFAVKERGVVFDSTGQVLVRGLTRPHSLRYEQDKLYLANSGYGTVGLIDNHKYRPLAQLPGWTRGLHFHNKVAFVGVSRVLKRFEHYAPGLNPKKNISAIYAFSTNDFQYLGRLIFPEGNQIFSLESMPADITKGFVFKNVNTNSQRIKSKFYQFKI